MKNAFGQFYIYIFYRFCGFYNYKNPMDGKIHSFIIIGALFLINMLTISLFIQTIFKNDFIKRIRIDNGPIDRFALIPILISPIYIFLYLYYRKHRVVIIQTITDFKRETIEERKRKGRFIVFYLGISVLLLFLSIISPLYI
jgi:hypothetical protein